MSCPTITGTTIDSAENSADFFNIEVAETNYCNMYYPKTKTFATHYTVMFFQNTNMTNFLQPKFYFVMKSLSICPGMLTKIILEFGEQRSLYND